MNARLRHVRSHLHVPLNTSGWPVLRSALSDRAWFFMKRHAGEITVDVLRFADGLAMGGEIRPGHLGVAIRRHRRAPLPFIHEETSCAN